MARGACSHDIVEVMVPVLLQPTCAAKRERSWRRLNGHNQLPKIIIGVKFADGIEVVRPQAQPAAA